MRPHGTRSRTALSRVPERSWEMGQGQGRYLMGQGQGRYLVACPKVVDMAWLSRQQYDSRCALQGEDERGVPCRGQMNEVCPAGGR